MGFFGAKPPGGVAANTQVIFNDAGALGGSPDFLFDKVTKTLTVLNCRILSAFLAQGSLKTAQNTPPADGDLAPGEMAIWFDPVTRTYNVKAKDQEGAVVNFQLVRADDPRLSDARPALAHTHPGTEVTSQVGSAATADTVPWSGIVGKPSTFPPSAHTHSGTDIQVNSILGNRLVDGAVDDQKLKSHATADPQRAVTRNHIRDSAISAEKLADGAVSFQKLFRDQNVFNNLGPTQQALNGGAAFSPGVYACALSIPNGATCVFAMHVGYRNSNREFSVFNVVSATLDLSGVPGAVSLQFSAMYDGRSYTIVARSDGTASIYASSAAPGQTTFSFRRIA